MKHLGKVVCAIIERGDHFLIAERPSDHPLGGQWEFPGGKVAGQESPGDAIRREILEELNTEVAVVLPLTPNSHSYADVSLTLIPFVCSIVGGNPEPLEHSRIAWVTAQTVTKYPFAAADIPILTEYLAMRKARFMAGEPLS